MTSEQLRKIVRTQPFEPFEIFLADGRSFHVNHPEMVAITGGGRIALVTMPEGENYEVVDLLLVTSRRRGNGTVNKGSQGNPS